MNLSVKELLERILSVASKRAGHHCGQESDGEMSFTPDYGIYVSIIDDATTALDRLKATGE